MNKVYSFLIWRVLKSHYWIRALAVQLCLLALSKRYMKRLTDRVQQTLKIADTDEARRISHDSLKHSLEAFFHVLDPTRVPDQIINERTNEDTRDHCLQTLKDQPGVIASVHMGFPDYPCITLQKAGVSTVTLIGRGQSNPMLHQLGKKILNELEVDCIPRSASTVFHLMQAVRNKQAVLVHSDLRDRGADVRFFGFNTSIPVSAPMLSVMTGTPLYFAYLSPAQDGNQPMNLTLSMIEEDDRSKALSKEVRIQLLSEKLTKHMESVIQSQPEHWLWSYNRFKGCVRDNNA